MKRFILLIISIVNISTIFCQTENIDCKPPQQLWGTIHSWGDWGEADDIDFRKDNILSQPENIKAVIVYFANQYFYKEKEKRELAKLLGFSTLETANQTLSKKWIINATLPERAYFDRLSVIRRDNKVLFFSSLGAEDVISFEVNKDGKMIFAEQYNSREMGRKETPTDREIRLKYEASFSATNDKGVIINGVRWATRNVGTAKTFVPEIEDFGKHYKFNSNIGWDGFSDKNKWGSVRAISSTWEKENDPCPQGWRVPTVNDFRKLLDTTKVDFDKLIRQNCIIGMKFTDKSTKESIFLPCANYRNWEWNWYGLLGPDEGYGDYWSNTRRMERSEDEYGYMFVLYLRYDKGAILSANYHLYGLSVRCVAE